MCLHLEWFFNFKELKGGYVYTTNNTTLITYEICSIQLRNHDESIINLNDVRYVQDLMKNLNFLGTLESKDFEVKAKFGVMKIISDACVVMKGVHKNNNLYHYFSTVNGQFL